MLSSFLMVSGASAQVTNVVFTDNFPGTTLNTNKWKVTSYSQEGGSGNFTETVSNGVVEITGTTTEQWWGGGEITMATNFPVNAETNVVFSVTRVADNSNTGDTAYRSMLFILPPGTALTDYILFANDTPENGWDYNQKVGVSTDVPTGGGTALATLNASMNDGLSHVMKAVVNGSTVSLYLDDVFGVTAPFPFDGVTFSIGAEARANNDTSDVIFANPQVVTVGFEAFSPASVTLLLGQNASNVVVRIPPGANKSQAVPVTVTSDTPSVAVPVGAVGGSSTLTFAAGATNVQVLPIQSVAVGGAIFSLTNNIGMGSANTLSAVVLLGPGVRLTEDFVGNTINTSTWSEDTNGFETTGVGTYTAEQTNGTLVISGQTDTANYWAGLALETKAPFTATPQLPLEVTVDRDSINPISNFTTLADTGARTGVFLTTAGRPNSKLFFFGQDVGETGWEVNGTTAPLAQTGSGTAVSAFSSLNDTNKHQMKLVANGSTVEVFLDGISGGSYPFPVTAGIYVELGAYARAVGDSVIGVFSNLEVQNILPSIAVSPATIETQQGVNTNVITVTAPQLRTNAVSVTITSLNPSVATLQGATAGVLTLQFPQGGANSQSVDVVAAGVGQTSFVITNTQGLQVSPTNVAITVTAPTAVLFSDLFTNTTFNSNYWTLSTNSPGVDNDVTNSVVSATNGVLEMYVQAVDSTTAYLWAGFGLYLTKSYNASLLSPITFEVDRTSTKATLTSGNATLEWTGVWITGPDTNYVWFGDYDTHLGQAGGWEYFDSIGATTNSPLAGVGVVLSALAAPSLNDLGNHQIKVEANGSVLQFWLDGIYGGSAPFPYTNGISFGLGTYVDTGNNVGSIVQGYFSNATVLGPMTTSPKLSAISFAREAGGSIMLTWTGAGILQSASSLSGPWSAVTPAPTGTTYTVTPVVNTRLFFRLSSQ